MMFSGAVELENLPLKKDALRQLGIPIEIKSGFIGKVKLQVPVSQFRSAPWVICIEQLYVVTGPVSMAQVLAKVIAMVSDLHWFSFFFFKPFVPLVF